ncbi:hypothetical protein [Mycobacterium sp. E740]|uniref:hypothetical protein n=1 Tax=Mycobacterium sp. E740 TaxID=1834149 RepID=UPI00080108B4|nr:hypothetical protein [Mycobacterium sp. E740]OBI76213.1 hypothetical protein A5663_03340 [Mycobacterium sp. E740]
MKPRTRRALVVIATVITIAAAAVVWQNLPTPPDITGPFDVHGDAGQRTAGRDIAVTVTDVRVTPMVNSVAPAGIWVVVDATVEAPISTELPRSDLIVGPNTYTPTDRFFLKTLRNDVSPGFEQRGSWVFDVAPALVAPGSSEPVTLRVWTGFDEQLDSRLIIDIPRADIDRAQAVTLEPPGDSAS